jgi:hypothetical protein
VARCAVQPFSVDLVQIQQEERLGLAAKSNWAEALIKPSLLPGEIGGGVPVKRE